MYLKSWVYAYHRRYERKLFFPNQTSSQYGLQTVVLDNKTYEEANGLALLPHARLVFITWGIAKVVRLVTIEKFDIERLL